MKKKAIKEFLEELPTQVIVALHNDYCERNHSDMTIYPLNEENINRFFPTAFDLIKAVKESTHFHPASEPYFRFSNDNISTNWSVVIDYDKLAEHLVDWGDAGYGFDITQHLQDAFVKYAYDILAEQYTKRQVQVAVKNSQMDFLMDDWFDIILEDFPNVVGMCPHCNEVIYADAPHGYIYETGKTEYECETCGNTIYF
jgi:hypothetical protein